MGMGLSALAPLLHGQGNPMLAKGPHFAPKAKRVIHLFMNGGPSHVDTFDPKPELSKWHGKVLPDEHRLNTERKTGAAYQSPFAFKQHGQSGLPVSDLFPQVAKHADDLCVIRSMRADVPNHEPSLMLMNCGDGRLVRPSMGSWITYGLGTENQNLPGFVVLCPNGYPITETQNWRSAFLPGIYQGTYVNPAKKAEEAIIPNLNPARSNTRQSKQLQLLQKLNRAHQNSREGDDQLDSRIRSFELAYRMQMEASDAFDVTKESAKVREMYGTGVHARQCLMARRLVERGVRFVQLWHGKDQPWDSHDQIEKNHRRLAEQCDQAIGALLQDLKDRGMLEETLVLWGGEFGRTPTVELPSGANAGTTSGRDHNHHGFTMWMAGGGVKPGYVHGATDPFGFKAVEDPVHVHDLHATMLQLLGFDHEQLTYRYAGRDFRLTDVHGKVVTPLIA
tara:strand:- start:4185 stop:5531 length:1347 start_codon:yes stop_codon:yes gene_type:complete